MESRGSLFAIYCWNNYNFLCVLRVLCGKTIILKCGIVKVNTLYTIKYE
nr:hypothetical protein GZ19C7_4 [uncultured archaeon GZfos19C7]